MVRLLYFGSLPDLLGTASEETRLPPSVTDVGSLLSWLRGRRGAWERALVKDAVQVTVNKEFATAQTPVSDTDEIALVSIGLTR